MDLTEIQSVRSLLHLIYHRNKNQHSRAKWWKSLSILKRTVSSLSALDAKSFATSPYPQYLRHVVPKCYLAFSTVVADNQFSTLGIVLLSVLARLVKATGTKFPKSASASAPPQAKSKLPGFSGKTRIVAPVAPLNPSEDRGERISRGVEEGEAREARRVDLGVEPVEEKKEKKVKKKMKVKTKGEETEKEKEKGKEKEKKVKSKRKKKDAIDDLFSGLF